MASLNPGTGAIDLGVVSREESTKSSNLLNYPIPLSDSDASVLADIMGTSRTITIQGVKTGTVAELRTFITNIEALQNGNQSAMRFVSSWRTAYSTSTWFLIQDFTHTKNQADENKVEYNLTLIEGVL